MLSGVMWAVLGLAAGADGEPKDATPERARALRIAVYEFEPRGGVTPVVASVVTESIVLELRKLDGLAVISLEEIQAMLQLEAEKQMAGCSDDEGCLAEIADALGVDGLVSGELTREGEQSVFVMRRLDQRKARTVGTVNKRLAPKGGEELLAAVGPAVEELFPEFPLRRGATRGVDPRVALELNPPPLQPIWFWTAAGVAASALAASLLVGALAGAAWADQALYVDRSRREVLDGAGAKQKAEIAIALAVAANVGLVVALGSAGVVGVLWPFTDFRTDDEKGVGR